MSSDPLDPEVRRIIDQARRADELRARYAIDMKMTFSSPGSRPDDLGNVCPICRARTPTSARYADYVCEPCTERAEDENGARIVFGNADLFGGVVARVDGEKRQVTTCRIGGRECVVNEARFGGVVYSAAGLRVASQDPSRHGNRLAERVAGAVLGAAIGDALGHPTEFVQSFDDLRSRFGPLGVQGFATFREEAGRRFAPYTDDTQLAELVLVSLLDARRAGEDLERAMTRLAAAIVRWSTSPQGGHRAPGRACLSGAARLAAGEHWSRAGAEDAGGSGSVMRAYPVGLVFHSDWSLREEWAVAQSTLTHRAPIALAASSAMAHATASALAGDAVSDTVRALVEHAARHDAVTAEMIAGAAASALAGEEPEPVLGRLKGWAAHEAIAAATYVYVRHADDFRSAVLEAANTPGDSDTIATLVGALVGARCGTNAIAADWLRDVERGAELRMLAARTLAESGYTDWDDVLAQLGAIGS